MSLTIYEIKRWVKMLSGNSIDHVNQDLGKCFDIDSIKGYYNNLTEKVTKNPSLLDSDALPKIHTESHGDIDFPIAIFQYGLGAYDLFLIERDNRYLKKFLQCAEWAINSIDSCGRWNNFFFYSPQAPYSAMAQGEGTSLLLRAYKHTCDNRYLDASKKAVDFMLNPLKMGGTTLYNGSNAYLMEYTFKGMVLNGAIFAWWGLYDFVKATEDNSRYKEALDNTLLTLINILPKFSCRYWSMYSLDGLIASPFYHRLHIAQMDAMYCITHQDIFKEYASIWRRQQCSTLCTAHAFVRKSLQKILE